MISMKVKNTMGNRYSGTLGKETVASSWKGIHYLREYKIPVDPKSELQLQHRAIFARAVETWHALDDRQKELYNKAAIKMTGYNLFIREYIDAARNGRELRIKGASEGPPRGGSGLPEVAEKDAEDRPHAFSQIFE